MIGRSEPDYDYGYGLGAVLFIVLLILKLVGVVGWSWWWVTAPLWIPAIITCILWLTVLIVLAFIERKPTPRYSLSAKKAGIV